MSDCDHGLLSSYPNTCLNRSIQDRSAWLYPYHLPLTTGTPVFGETWNFLGFRRPLQLPVLSIEFITHSPVTLFVTDPAV